MRVYRWWSAVEGRNLNWNVQNHKRGVSYSSALPIVSLHSLRRFVPGSSGPWQPLVTEQDAGRRRELKVSL